MPLWHPIYHVTLSSSFSFLHEWHRPALAARDYAVTLTMTHVHTLTPSDGGYVDAVRRNSRRDLCRTRWRFSIHNQHVEFIQVRFINGHLQNDINQACSNNQREFFMADARKLRRNEIRDVTKFLVARTTLLYRGWTSSLAKVVCCVLRITQMYIHITKVLSTTIHLVYYLDSKISSANLQFESTSKLWRSMHFLYDWCSP